MNMEKYRIKNATQCFMFHCYKVQVKKWYGWSTIKSFKGFHNMNSYLISCAEELIEALEKENMFMLWEMDMEYQRDNRIFKPLKIVNDHGIKCEIRQGSTHRYEVLMCVEDVCRLVFMDLDEIKSILNTEFIKGKALIRGFKNYNYEEILYMRKEDFIKILEYYQNKKQ